MKTLKLLIAAGLLAFGSVASATTIVPDDERLVIDFGTGLIPDGVNAGSITFDGNDVTGTNIFIGALNVTNAIQANGGYTIDAVLNFDTAANTIEVVGTVAGLGITDSTTLLSGNFGPSGWSYDGTNPYVEVFSGSGRDTKAPELLTALGESVETDFEFFAFSLEANYGNVTSSDIVNTAVNPRTPEVPIPAAAWLFGTGLIGLVGVARRKA